MKLGNADFEYKSLHYHITKGFETFFVDTARKARVSIYVVSIKAGGEGNWTQSIGGLQDKTRDFVSKEGRHQLCSPEREQTEQVNK